MSGAGRRPKRPPRPGAKGGREARRWDDPDEDSDGEDGGEEKFHPQTDLGLKDGEESDDSQQDLKGSDSEAEAGEDPLASLGGLEAFTRKRPQVQARHQDDGLWDPLAGLAPRKKLRSAPVGHGQTGPRGKGSGPPEGTAVVLVGLQKAPQLNGKAGTVGGAVDGATGRCPVLLADGTVKSLKPENLRQILTGAVVRLKGLQGAPQLNGALGECGVLDLSAERYNVVLADGKETMKKVKEANLELVSRYMLPDKHLASQKKLFTWTEAIRQGKDRESQGWCAQLALLTEFCLPQPCFLDSQKLKAAVAAADSGRAAAVAAADLPRLEDGRLACRVLAASTERDLCCPASKAASQEEMKRLGNLAEALQKRDDSKMPIYFLLPSLCTDALPCLRASAALAWPLYLQLCQALVCVQTEHWPHKAWSRVEQLLMHQVLSKPVYLLSQGGVSTVVSKPSDEGSWLLSDRAEETMVGAPADGQALPAERRLLESFCSDALPGGWRKGARVTWYRL
eukprot:TRINITY_DN88723_c0_g1_i1.p1 TRINITY_DN88723_c0_g1~~TRINITY_DN88723_c0_g1_i1.p1  ORF type:complete len:535 (-),score=85.90 TRINITY_DN88723_c0_g1_i1:115-1644(-)